MHQLLGAFQRPEGTRVGRLQGELGCGPWGPLCREENVAPHTELGDNSQAASTQEALTKCRHPPGRVKQRE